MSGRGGTVVFWTGLAILILVVTVAARGDANNEPLDPRSVAPDGARGMVELVERFGAEVEIVIDVPDGSHEVAVLLRDPYGVGDRRRLESWVRDGGRLLVADPTSPLTPATTQWPSDPTGVCRTGALAGVSELSGVEAAFVEDAGDQGGERCLGGAIAVTPLGEGVIVALGGPAPLLNERLDEADNAVLAVSILVPAEGTRVAFVDPDVVVGDDRESLADLVADEVWLVLIQLAVGFTIFAWSRAVRLGRPVSEPLPVHLAGSEPTAARGRLMAAVGDPRGVAGDLRTEARRRCSNALTIPMDTDGVTLERRVAEATGWPPDRVASVMSGDDVRNEADLVRVAAALAEIEAALDPRTTLADAEPRSTT